MILDLHCHIDLYEDPLSIVEECRKRDAYILSVTTTPSAWRGTDALSQNNKRIRTAIGLHPQLAHERFSELEMFDSLIPDCRYVGEIGLDGSRAFKNHWEVQLKVFRHILKRVNREGGRIMSIHSRSSASTVLDELRGINGIPILHWFTGTKEELDRANDQKSWFSVGPAMINSKKGRELVSLIPRNRILTETDGPFTKFNQRQLMPWDATLVYPVLANIWDISVKKVENQLKENFIQLVS